MFGTTMWGPLQAVWTEGSGRSCRVCGSAIASRDGFGMSEAVCPACRGDQSVSAGPTPTPGNLVEGGARFAARAAVAIGQRASRSIASLRRAA